MSLTVDSTIGLEDVQRQGFIVLVDHLADALAAVSAKWEPLDEALADRLGLPFTPTVLESVDVENYYEGHVPSLIKAPVEKYPNVAVMVFRGLPDEESGLFDHADKYRNSLVIDAMVKSNVSEEDCNRRIHRMAEAVNLCIRSNSTLYGTVDGIDTGPTVEISDLFVRKEKTRGHYGAEWYWQGARLSYGVKKLAPIPSSSGGFMHSAGIDQA